VIVRKLLSLAVALATSLCALAAHPQPSAAEPARGVLVAARTFIDTKRWTCLVDPRGEVFCSMRTFRDFWPAPTIPSTSPSFEKVAGLSRVTAIEATGEYVCALDARGTVSCWGCLYSSCRMWPKRIALAEPATQLAVEDVGACALLKSGAVQCWGASHNGQLGPSVTQPTLSEEPVTIPLSVHAVQVTATVDARCVLDTEAQVTCWGNVCRGDDDPLGARPRRMAQLGRASAIAANLAFTCAVVEPERQIRCWGYADYGQTSAAANKQEGRHDCQVGSIRHVKHVKQLALGELSGAALTEDGNVWFWGRTHYGGARQLGSAVDSNVRVRFDGDLLPVVDPPLPAQKPKRFDQEPVRVARDQRVQTLMLSNNYMCLELTGGEVLCEWMLSRTPNRIQEVWPAVRFEGSAP
jgi:alpha-tubulin suppressor-like RCC1 family protein